MENLLNVVLPYIVTVIGGYLTVKIVKIVPSVISYIIAKVGSANYKKMKDVSHDIWGAIEENSRIGMLVSSKAETFENLIKSEFPQITDERITILRQSIAREYNKDKEPVEKAIENSEGTTNPIVGDPSAPIIANTDIINQIKELITKL